MDQQLEITRRLLGSSAIVSHEEEGRDITVELDVEGMIRRLLLFDTYILYSVRLKEVPEMVKHFGYEGTMALLSSGALEIRCDCAQFMEGQFNTAAAPPLTFQFHVIEAHGRDQYVINNLSEVNRIALSPRELMNLQSAVVSAVHQPDNRTMFSSLVAPSFESDLLHNSSLLGCAVHFVLAKEKGIRDAQFDLRLHKVGEDRYQAETDMPQKLSLSLEDTHKLIRAALMAISTVDLRLGEMNMHTALSGFTEEELPLFDKKIESVGRGSAANEARFQRVVALAGLPEFSPGSRIDIE